MLEKQKDAEEKRCELWNEVELYSDSGIDYINFVKLSEPVSEMGLIPPHIVSVGKESACNAGAPGSILGLGGSPGEGKGYPLQYTDLENSQPMDLQRVSHD